MDYTFAFIGLGVILFTVLIQSIVTYSILAVKQDQLLGKTPEFDPNDMGFKVYACYRDTIDSLPLLLGAVMLAQLSNTDTFWTGVFVWGYGATRLIHMVLYYSHYTTTTNFGMRRVFSFMASAFFILSLIILALVSSSPNRQIQDIFVTMEENTDSNPRLERIDNR